RTLSAQHLDRQHREHLALAARQHRICWPPFDKLLQRKRWPLVILPLPEGHRIVNQQPSPKRLHEGYRSSHEVHRTLRLCERPPDPPSSPAARPIELQYAGPSCSSIWIGKPRSQIGSV